MSKLEVIFVDSRKKTNPAMSPPVKKTASTERRAKFERLWLNQAEALNPENSALGRQRIKEATVFIKQVDYQNAVDLGCGSGSLVQALLKNNALVDAVDISSNALNILTTKIVNPKLKTLQDSLPITKLEDYTYDLVLSTDVIADLEKNEQRLYFSELSRLLKRDGQVICSTDLDYLSLDALQRFLTLAETEFSFLKLHFSYNRLYLQTLNALSLPSHYLNAWEKPSLRHQEIKNKRGLDKKIFTVMTRKPAIHFWKMFNKISKPLKELVKQSQWTLNILEKITKILYKEKGISHVTFLARRKKIGE